MPTLPTQFWGFIDKANLDQELAKNLMLLGTVHELGTYRIEGGRRSAMASGLGLPVSRRFLINSDWVVFDRRLFAFIGYRTVESG